MKNQINNRFGNYGIFLFFLVGSENIFSELINEFQISLQIVSQNLKQ